MLTVLLDAEAFHVCEKHQKEYIEVGYDEMQKRYPLAGEDERNPEFFKEQTERYIARAERLTEDELRLLIRQEGVYAQGYAQAILDGKMLDNNEMELLGESAEQYIDEYR